MINKKEIELKSLELLNKGIPLKEIEKIKIIIEGDIIRHLNKKGVLVFLKKEKEKELIKWISENLKNWDLSIDEVKK